MKQTGHAAHTLHLAQLLEATEVEGPGLRSALWLQGCSIRCPHCCNPQFFPRRGGTPWEPARLAAHLMALPGEGITLLGGEPLDQAAALLAFLRCFRQGCDKSVMLFSGYSWEQLQSLALGPAVLAHCDLVVAGPFLAEQSPDTRRWIGSRNQTCHVLTARYAALGAAWEPARQELELHLRDGELILNGMPFEGPAWDWA